MMQSVTGHPWRTTWRLTNLITVSAMLKIISLRICIVEDLARTEEFNVGDREAVLKPSGTEHDCTTIIGVVIALLDLALIIVMTCTQTQL